MVLPTGKLKDICWVVVNEFWFIHFQAINSFCSELWLLEGPREAFDGRRFCCVPTNQQGLVPLWAGLFGGVWCHPQKYYLSGFRNISRMAKGLKAQEGASLQLHLEWGRDSPMEYQRGSSHLTSHPFCNLSAILVALRFFPADHSGLFHRALKCSQKVQFPAQLLHVPL